MSAEMETITQLTIDEFWAFERMAEPIRMGVPLPEGMVKSADELCLLQDEEEIPLQVRELARWHADGSLRWVLLDFLADLDLRKKISLELVKGEGKTHAISSGIGVSETEDGIRVDTGALSCRVPRQGEWVVDDFCCPVLGSLLDSARLTIEITEQRFGRLNGRVNSVTVVDSGPLAAEIMVAASLEGDAQKAVLDADILLRFFPGKSCFQATVTLISREEDLNLIGVVLRLSGMSEKPTEVRRFGGKKGSETSIRYDFETVRDGHGTVFEDSPVANWVSYRAPSGGVLGSIRKARYRFDKEVEVDDEGVHCYLWPMWANQYHMYPWMAMTNEALFEFFPPETPSYELAKDCFLFERPVKPVLPTEYYRRCKAFGDIFPNSQKYQLFEGALSRALKHRPRGIGQMHFGDEPSGIYTAEGRRGRGLLFANGEYDFPHLLFMQYARTGHRHWYEMAEAAAMHWIDVDWLRDCANPLYAGGIACHDVDHRANPGAGPSHEWNGGLLDFYHLTGNASALRAARSVADNVAGYIEKGLFDRVGTYQMRELGWGLVALANIYAETCEERHLEAGRQAGALIEKWIETFGQISEVQRFADGADSADDPVLPVAVYRDNFSSITINGLRRFADAAGDEGAQRLFLEQAEAQLEWFNSSDGWAEQRETRYPMLECFAYAFLRTGRSAYLDAGLRILEFGLTNGELRFETIRHRRETDLAGYHATFIEPHAVPINSQLLGLTVTPMLCFLQVAEDEGLLENFFPMLRT